LCLCLTNTDIAVWACKERDCERRIEIREH
jgi:hypothetical protein